MTMEDALPYLNEEYEQIVVLDIQKFFGIVVYNQLFSILREYVNGATVLLLTRAYLRSGVLYKGLMKSTMIGFHNEYQ